MSKNPYALIEFMQAHGLVPYADDCRLRASELRIPVPQTYKLYYLLVKDDVVVATYTQSDVVWKHV